jgi:hypothetical protein
MMIALRLGTEIGSTFSWSAAERLRELLEHEVLATA